MSETTRLIGLHETGSPLLKLREPVRRFGCAAHPDHLLDRVHFSDKEYVKQLQKYKETTGSDPRFERCSRPHLLERLT